MSLPESSRQCRDFLIEALCLTRDIDEVEEALEEHRRQDRPAFERWFDAHFTREREALRDLERELHESIDRYNAVIAMAKMHDLPFDRAYRRVVEEDRAFARAAEDERGRIEDERRTRRRFLAREMELEFQRHADQLRPDDADSPPPAPLPVDDWKTIYRRVAKRLHPDLERPGEAADRPAWRRRYWSLLQEAHAREDAHALFDLDLATRVRRMDFADFDRASAERAHAWFENDFERLEIEIERARRSAAWEFGRKRKSDLLRRVRRELAEDAEALREDLRKLRADQESLTRAHEPGRPGRGSRAAKRTGTSTQQLSFFD